MQVYSVGQVNAYIHGMFEQNVLLSSIYIKGELSNVKYHTSGHIYFTLKDRNGAMAGVMFAGNRGGLSFRMQEGQSVIVGGSVSVYERDGKYQIYAREITLDGAGALYERYEQLRKELEEMGMFAKEYKQPIPEYIGTLGVVTARTGAAVQDIIHIAKRRNPYIQIIVYPAKVQGDGAAESIVNGIRALEDIGVDTMIVGRGGGSIEDLWAFNEEIVARAIFECSIPIISAVGHETDTTIADWVADLRAPTPSAAAELAVFEYAKYVERSLDYHNSLNHLIRQEIHLYREICERCRMRLKHLSPQVQIKEKRVRAINLEEKLTEAMNQKIWRMRHILDFYIEKMNGLSPLLKLNQGYSLIEGEDGRTVTDIHQVEKGDRLRMHVKNGSIEAEVLSTKGAERTWN